MASIWQTVLTSTPPRSCLPQECGRTRSVFPVDETVPQVRPVKGQLVHLRSRSKGDLVQHTIRGIDVYIVPRADGRVVVGATVEEQGFDTTITAGAVMDLLRDAYELVPGLAEYELTEVASGLRPATMDNEPVLGPTDVPGLSLATGHYRNGILLAPITGDLMAEFLFEGSVPELMKPFLADALRADLEGRVVNLVVNGSTVELGAEATVAELVEQVAPGRAERGTAVAVNGEVVPKTQWSVARLSSGDRVEVLHAIGGG